MAEEIYLPIVGNLTSSPELRYTQNGIAVASFTIAKTPRHFNKQTNEYRDGTTTFIRCSVWREQAEYAASSLEKGMRVIAYGALQSREWETKEGEKRTSLELNVDDIGPSLRWATAAVTRAPRQGGTDWGQQPASQPSDSWATASVPNDEEVF